MAKSKGNIPPNDINFNTKVVLTRPKLASH